MKTLTVVQAKHLADKADTLFEKAARAWERGNNSGDSERLAIEEKRCDHLRNEAETLLKPLGIVCDYPGLYPSFKVAGFDYYDCLGAISAAIADKETRTCHCEQCDS